MRALAVALAALALALPADASAHATLQKTTPANGAVVDSAPARVLVEFDDVVHVAGGNAAVANDSQASVLAGKPAAHGHTLTIPLRRGLADGAYTVRWSIVSDDGHREQGVIAFAVGAGSPPPTPSLAAGAGLTWNDVLVRTLYYAGLLAAAGAAFFGLATRRLLRAGLDRPLSHLLFSSFLLAFLGGSGMLHAAIGGTRYDLVLKVAVVLALLGGAAAALAPAVPPLLSAAAAFAVVLLAAPTLSGHALDRSQPRLLSIPADLAHTAAAALWLGGLLFLVYVVPQATADPERRLAAARRFSSTALAAVAVLGATGLARAVTELDAVSQVWSTSYGRALIAKTAIFLPLLGIGWLNRTLLISAFARLRRSATVEIVAVVGVLVAVAFLTELRPGIDAPSAAAARVSAPQPPALPPRDAVVDARRLGSLAVAVARQPSRATVTVVGPDGTGIDGRVVQVNGAPAAACGSGCYAAAAPATGPLLVSLGNRSLVFAAPATAPDATARLARVGRAYRASKTIVFDETLSSSASDATTTRFTAVAPDRLAFRTRGGASAVVIGDRRWDRARDGAPWLASSQTPLDVTQPYWTSATNVHLVAPRTITFLDRKLPAWFRLTLSGDRPAVQRMTAAAHFMVDRYVGFDVPAEVSPPVSR